MSAIAIPHGVDPHAVGAAINLDPGEWWFITRDADYLAEVPDAHAALFEAALAAAVAGEPYTGARLAAPVPPVVSRMQALLALDAAGLLDDVEALVATQARPTQIAWAHAPDFHRTSPLMAQLWAALGRTEAELDDLFRAAGAIQP